ncbi:MAG: MFS transporter, partial [Firmicutes bacterium]|nr:MFS transporter [Bacillota bacterium]
MDDRILTKRFILIFGSQFSVAMVMYTLMSTITEYATNLGTGATIAGLVSGIYVFGGLCSRLYSGAALGKVGWKKLAIIFLTLHSVACVFYFFVDSVFLLILIRFIHGIGFGASANAIVTMGMSILPEKRFSEACGYLMMSTTLAVGIGPFFGGIVYDNLGSSGCFVMATALGVLSLIFVLLVDIRDVDPGVKKREKTGSEKVNVSAGKEELHGIHRVLEVKALPIAIVTALSALGYISVMSFYRLYAVETNLTEIFGKFFLIYAGILLFSRPLAGKIQDRYGDKIVCYPGIL